MRAGLTTALLIKLVMTFVLAVAAFTYIDGNPWSQVFWVSLIATVVNYLIGDSLVLPSLGNVVAAIGDGLMGSVVAYLAAVIMPAFSVTWTSLIVFAILVAVGEYFFHRYLIAADARYRPATRTSAGRT
ncbi:MAG: DUF2512 family protein [Bacillota bacterium]